MENQKCLICQHDLETLKTRVNQLENYREKDKENYHKLDKSLNIFITEMRNISQELKITADNAKEAVTVSNKAHEKDINMLKEKVDDLENKTDTLSDRLNKETIGADAEKWKKLVSTIITAILSGIVGLLFGLLGLK